MNVSEMKQLLMSEGTPLNKVDYTNYTVINDYTCDIDEPEEVEIFNNILRS